MWLAAIPIRGAPGPAKGVSAHYHGDTLDIPGLNFNLGEDLDMLRDAVRTFANAEIAPRA